MRWVQTRIVPTDRQNLGSILKENKLKEYDPYMLLMLGCGRCSQDDCAVVPTDLSMTEEWLTARRLHKLDYAAPIGEGEILSIFRDGSIWRMDPVAEGCADDRLRMILRRPDLMQQMRMIPGGLGVKWQGNIMLTAEQLYGKGVRLPFDHDEFDGLLKYYVMLTPEVSEKLGCSRQYIDRKVHEGRLSPLKHNGTIRLYTASEVIRTTE